MHRTLIIETYFNVRRQNFYYLMLPDVGEDGFYRAVSSYNAFFSSVRNPKANVTEVRQFTATAEEDIKHRKAFYTNVKWNKLRTFQTIWEFYDFIGYDRKTRTYTSGEVCKIWDAARHGFRVPKKRR